MGKTQQPLRILVAGGGAFQSLPIWQELENKGHVVHFYLSPEPFDLIVGPECWRMNEQLLIHLDAALKTSRKIKVVQGKGVEKKASAGKKVRRRKDTPRLSPAESA